MKKHVTLNKSERKYSTNSVTASCGISGIIVVGVLTERLAIWSDGEDVVGIDCENAWVIDWSKDGLSTELRFFSVCAILLNLQINQTYFMALSSVDSGQEWKPILKEDGSSPSSKSLNNRVRGPSM
jgi:hypothetical protein